MSKGKCCYEFDSDGDYTWRDDCLNCKYSTYKSIDDEDIWYELVCTCEDFDCNYAPIEREENL